MSGTTPDDPEVARLLADADGLRQRYRAASADEPPAALDDAIRAAARREVRGRPRSLGSPFGASWRIPLSIAAVVVVSATVTLMVAERGKHVPVAGESALRAPAQDAAEKQRGFQSVPEASAPPSIGDAVQGVESADKPKLADRFERRRQAPALEDTAPRAKKEDQRESLQAQIKPAVPPPAEAESAGPEKDSAQPGAPPAPAAFKQAEPAKPTPAEPKIAAGQHAAGAGHPARGDSSEREPAPAPRQMREESARDAAAPLDSATRSALRALAKEKAETSVGNVATSGEKPASAEQKAATSRGPREPWESGPQAWLKHIEELMRAGRHDEAKTSFKAFRERYPSYVLPPGFAPPGP